MIAFMKTLALISQKGGSGKTTIALNLAIAAAKEGKQVVVVDLDPQRSALRWSRLQVGDQPVIVAGHRAGLDDLYERACDGGADLLVLDTAPKSETTALAAATRADLVLIPTRPSNFDLDAFADTVNITRLAKKPAMFVLNDCKTTSTLPAMAAEALGDYDVPLAPVLLTSRVSFVKAFIEGQGVLTYEPNGPAAGEVAALYGDVCKHLDMKACTHAGKAA